MFAFGLVAADCGPPRDGAPTVVEIAALPITTSSDLLVADMNGDADVDVVVAGGGGVLGHAPRRSVQVVVRGVTPVVHPFDIGDGPGLFRTNIAAADLDRDGDVDIAATDDLGERVLALLSDGAGGLAEGWRFDGVRQPQDVAAADVDGDGIADLVATSWSDGEVLVFVGRGDATFADPKRLTLSGSPRALVVADHDGDGDIDIATHDRGEARIHLFTQGSTWSRTSLAVRGWEGGFGGLDVNADGRIDWLVGDDDTKDALLLLRRRGRAPLRRELSLGQPTRLDIAAARDMATGDFNGDGCLDLAAFDPLGDNAWIAYARAPGRFAKPIRHTLDVDAVASFDADRDGASDLFTIEQGGKLNLVTLPR